MKIRICAPTGMLARTHKKWTREIFPLSCSIHIRDKDSCNDGQKHQKRESSSLKKREGGLIKHCGMHMSTHPCCSTNRAAFTVVREIRKFQWSQQTSQQQHIYFFLIIVNSGQTYVQVCMLTKPARMKKITPSCQCCQRSHTSNGNIQRLKSLSSTKHIIIW